MHLSSEQNICPAHRALQGSVKALHVQDSLYLSRSLLAHLSTSVPKHHSQHTFYAPCAGFMPQIILAPFKKTCPLFQYTVTHSNCCHPRFLRIIVSTFEEDLAKHDMNSANQTWFVVPPPLIVLQFIVSTLEEEVLQLHFIVYPYCCTPCVPQNIVSTCEEDLPKLHLKFFKNCVHCCTPYPPPPPTHPLVDAADHSEHF